MNEKFVALGWQPAKRQTASLRYFERPVNGEAIVSIGLNGALPFLAAPSNSIIPGGTTPKLTIQTSITETTHNVPHL